MIIFGAGGAGGLCVWGGGGGMGPTTFISASESHQHAGYDCMASAGTVTKKYRLYFYVIRF